MKCTLALGLFCLGAALQSAAAEEATAWRPIPLIDNGQVAPGWKFTGYGGVSVADGAIRTDPDGRGLGLFYYAAEKFGDCQIRVVYKTEKPRSNSGVYLRIDDGILKAEQPAPVLRDAEGKVAEAETAKMQEASEKEQGPWYAVHHGYEIQICDGASKHHRTGSIYSLADAAEVPGTPGAWRTMVITLKGEKIDVELDGKHVSTFDPATSTIPERKLWYEPKREPVRPLQGYLGLQTHDPGDVVFFKEISVRPLKGAR